MPQPVHGLPAGQVRMWQTSGRSGCVGRGMGPVHSLIRLCHACAKRIPHRQRESGLSARCWCAPPAQKRQALHDYCQAIARQRNTASTAAAREKTRTNQSGLVVHCDSATSSCKSESPLTYEQTKAQYSACWCLHHREAAAEAWQLRGAHTPASSGVLLGSPLGALGGHAPAGGRQQLGECIGLALNLQELRPQIAKNLTSQGFLGFIALVSHAQVP